MKALILLSGGLDSTVLLGQLLLQGKECSTLSFDYGQRHREELHRAQAIAAHYKVEHSILTIDPGLFSSINSSLTNKELPVTLENAYVPGRNLLFLAHAASFAEARNISEIYFGAHAQDSPAFPDCQKEFFKAVQDTIHIGTKHPLHIFTPFIHLTKKEIISLGNQLKIPIELTLSCYDPQNGKPCGICPACRLRG